MARTQGEWVIDPTGTYTYVGYPGGLDILIIGENRYINFAALHGASGYGIRDNAGVIEFKNSGGAWAPIGTGGLSSSILPATGTIDDSNKTFTFTQKPTLIVINGTAYRETSTIGGTPVWSWSVSTATLAFPVGVGGDIYGIK